MRKVLFVFGTRPEAIKMAPMIKELQARPAHFDVTVCVTGQHREMLDQVLDFFSIVPDHNLHVMKKNQSLTTLTSSVLLGLEPVIEGVKPDITLVQGDTTSAFIGALASFYFQTKVGHLEAGLRSGDMYSPFPEEANRVLVSKIADYHFAPTARAVDALRSEGIRESAIFNVGNTVIDALLMARDIVSKVESATFEATIGAIDPERKIVLVTGHRRESFGAGFESMCSAIRAIAERYSDADVVYPVHLNPNVQEPVSRILGKVSNVKLIPPLDYPSLVWLLNKAHIVLTDSGGIQEEAPTLGKPVLVMREVTERQEGIDAGTAKLVGTDAERIVKETCRLMDDVDAYSSMANAVNPYGDGTAARQIADILENA